MNIHRIKVTSITTMREIIETLVKLGYVFSSKRFRDYEKILERFPYVTHMAGIIVGADRECNKIISSFTFSSPKSISLNEFLTIEHPEYKK
jgi:hypothetical protein